MNQQLRSDTLKKLAMVFMLFDHIGAAVLEKVYLTVTDFTLAQKIYDINQVCRGIGRLAMPIFCYQIVIGTLRTSNKYRHLLTLSLFALLSEIPFNLVQSGKILDIKSQNVFFMLTLGTLAIQLVEWFSSSDLYASIKTDTGRNAAYGLFCTAVVSSLSVVAELIHCDYGAKGVILIFIFYFFRVNTIQMTTTGLILYMFEVFAIMYLRSHNMHSVMKYCSFEAYSCLAFPLIAMDNGIRKGGKLLKWFGYFFYPVHLLVLYFISLIIVNAL